MLQSSCIRPYTPVFRAQLPCPHKKCLVFRGVLKLIPDPIPKGAVGDKPNALLCGVGQNLRGILRHLRVFFAAFSLSEGGPRSRLASPPHANLLTKDFFRNHELVMLSSKEQLLQTLFLLDLGFKDFPAQPKIS